MKTSIKSLIATGCIALAISTSTVYANGVSKIETVAATNVNVSAIKRIIISGNVEVTISQSPKSKVLYTNDGGTDVSVKKIGNALYVDTKSYVQGAKITVYVDDIYRIDAAGNAFVQTKDALSLKYLQVYVKDNAKVDLNSKTENLYTSIKNSSELNLKGSTDLYNIEMDKTARITLDKFNSKKTNMINSDVYVASRR